MSLIDRPEEVETYKNRFLQTMSFIDRVFPHGFRKSERARETYFTRFEAMSIGSYLALKEKPGLSAETPDVSTWLNGDEFVRITKSGGSNVTRLLRERLDFVRDRLLGE